MDKQSGVEQLNKYAALKGVEAIAKLSLDGLMIGLFVPPGECVLESSKLEDLASHIDILALTKFQTGDSDD